VSKDRVQPLKLEGTDTGGNDDDFFPTSLNRNEDYLDARGIVLQNASSNNDIVFVERDASDNLTFDDPIAGHQRLIDLLPGPGNYNFLLDCEPNSINNVYANIKTNGFITRETWTNSFTSKLWKSIDYTRQHFKSKVITEVRKIYAPDGLTVVAQMTLAYTRTAGRITGATVTRDI
jgi:hypothetical protein